jgi:hypothetical protein
MVKAVERAKAAYRWHPFDPESRNTVHHQDGKRTHLSFFAFSDLLKGSRSFQKEADLPKKQLDK